MIDGSLAITIRQRCVEAYKFIVQHFDADLGSKVYLFGLSRGAHTVRSCSSQSSEQNITSHNSLQHVTTQPQHLLSQRAMSQGKGRLLSLGPMFLSSSYVTMLGF